MLIHCSVGLFYWFINGCVFYMYVPIPIFHHSTHKPLVYCSRSKLMSCSLQRSWLWSLKNWIHTSLACYITADILYPAPGHQCSMEPNKKWQKTNGSWQISWMMVIIAPILILWFGLYYHKSPYSLQSLDSVPHACLTLTILMWTEDGRILNISVSAFGCN